MEIPNAMNMPLLQVSELTVRFGGVLAIDRVSFTVQTGELLGLIGPNGAGKTTLLRAITGVVHPTEGTVTFEDKVLNSLPIDRRIRMGLALSQQLVRPFKEISVIDNVALAAGYRKTGSPFRALMHVSRRAELAVAKQMLERVGIAEYADQNPAVQPLGVLKRLEVARALALNPRLLLLDEPLAGLNSQEAGALADTLLDINRQGVTLVMIEHNLGEVIRICQRLVVLDNGQKIAEGEPRSVMNLPVVRAAYLGGELQTGENHENTGQTAPL